MRHVRIQQLNETQWVILIHKRPIARFFISEVDAENFIIDAVAHMLVGD